MNKHDMKNIGKAIGFFCLALLFVFSAVWGSALIGKVVNPPSKPIPTSTSAPVYKSVVCPKDNTAFNDLIQNRDNVVDLIPVPKHMFAANGRFINSQVVITKNETKDSKVACGYLFVMVRTDYGPLQSWEDIYINPNSFGGHIDSSNQFGVGDGNELSEYIFSLNDIKYWKTRATRGVTLNADWSALLNVSETVSFEIALNTQNKTGFIDKMSIAYKCWNPSTGEENNGCKLNVISSSDKSLDTLK